MVFQCSEFPHTPPFLPSLPPLPPFLPSLPPPFLPSLPPPSPLLQSEVRVRVNNTQLGMVTYWDRSKFEARLEQMKEIHQVRRYVTVLLSSCVSILVCRLHPNFVYIVSVGMRLSPVYH